MKKALLLLLIIGLPLLSCNHKIKRALDPKAFASDWDSLAKYEQAPKWFKEAKFGIYAHWGLLSVAEYANDWYPRNMHIEGTDEFKHHVATYGEHQKFGYHDYVPLFKAERFNADEWANLFERAGAKFAGIVAEHHDGWSNWDSDINPWNAMDMGPRRDIVGELEKAIHGRGMKFVSSFHKARNQQVNRSNASKWLDDVSYFPYDPKLPTSTEDPKIAQLYGNIPAERFYGNWLGELKEVIDHYHPDLIYFDSKLNKIPDSYLREFSAYYINQSLKNGQQVVITHKEGELPKTVSLEDFEKGRQNKITKEYWLTDETVTTGSWSYVKGLQYKTANEIVDLLADIVSKNGAMMLNVSPKADGSIPKEQQAILLEIGDWMKINGEAIYASNTWKVFGEGPTKQEKSGMFLDKLSYTDQDVRYTQKPGVVYAIVLGRPDEGNITLSAFKGENIDIREVSVLGIGESIKYSLSANGLQLSVPTQKVDNKAYVYKIATN